MRIFDCLYKSRELFTNFPDWMIAGCSWVSLTNGSIRVLGNFISYNGLIAHQLNFLNIIPTVEDLLGIWKQRNLTIAGKIQVFKSLIFSKLVYIATMNAVAKTITDQLQIIHKDMEG